MDLPRLSNADLKARFGGDEQAMRRYRMLAALIRDGKSPGEIARTFGVSRESLRRLRHAYERQGLSALQSRKRGGGHVAHASPLAVALRTALDEQPGAAPALLWRRVRAQLQAQGVEVPRSTFYRLLATMRSAAPTPPPNEHISPSLLRDALGALMEDPPVALGRSALATLLLSNLRDSLQRGRRLQAALRNAIEQLRPAGAVQGIDDPRWRQYLILAGEYETGESRSSLQKDLVLSASTYSRAKREALKRLAATVPRVLEQLPPPEPPLSLIEPPPPPATFEHEQELDQYADRLRRSGLAVIWGPAGVGKQALAAVLADMLRGRGQKVFWHTCRPPDADTNPAHSLLVMLGAALSRDGRPALWEHLRSHNPAGMSERLRLLADGLVGRHWTVCIANAHWLVGDAAERVLDVLSAAREQRDLRLVLVRRDLPEWADAYHWPPLPFPSDAAARRRFVARFEEHITGTRRSTSDTSALREQVDQLLALLPTDALASLSPDQIARMLAALQPLEDAANSLRAALSPKYLAD